MQNHLDEAKKLLQKAKEINHNTVTYTLALMREELNLANATLEDIDSSEDEVAKMKRLGHLYNARSLLQLIKEKYISDDVTRLLRLMREDLKLANATLEDIDTSEKEVSEMKRLGHFNQANRWLQLIREGYITKYLTETLDYIREDLKLANATLEDIGTSEKEIAEMTKEK